MARAAVKAKQQQKAAAGPAKATVQSRRRRGHSSGGNPNQQLFFSRLRRKAKFAYVLLAVLFAVTFAFLGVGSGSGSGLDQLFNGLNLFGGGSGSAISKAEKAIEKNPGDAKGYRDLATAYEAKGDTASAITALQRYTAMKSKDAAALGELAGLQLAQASTYGNEYANAYAAEQAAAPGLTFAPTGKLGQALGTDPIDQARSSAASSVTSAAYQKLAGAYAQAVATYQQLAKLQPNDANVQFELGNAAQTSAQVTGSSTDVKTAIAAYKRYLTLSPDSSSAPQVKQLLKQLEKSQ